MKITANGQNIITDGDSIVIINGKISIDGKVLDIADAPKIHVTIEGNVGSIALDRGDITVSGNVGSIALERGDTTVNGNVAGNVNTTRGDIQCGDVGGNVNTSRGNISHRP